MLDLRGTPTYGRAAQVLSLALLLAGVWGLSHGLVHTVSRGSGEFISTYEPRTASLVGVVVTALVPFLAVRRPWLAWLLCIVVPLGVLGFQQVWLFTSFAGVLVVAALTWPRSRWWAAAMAVSAMVFPATLPWARFSATMPNGAVIQRFDGYTRVQMVTWEVGYALLVLLALGAAHGFWVYARSRESEQQLDHERHALGERSRLAHDLHDVVAHHVSLIAVRAETAPYTVAELQPEARVVLADIAQDARRALDELRDVLGILRRADEGDDRAPQPTGADVAELVGTARAAGEITLTGEDALAGLDAMHGYVAYRVVQEALTNARRHAPGGAVSVAASVMESGGVLLRVTNPVAGDGPVTPGRGLTGMRERVEAVGGTMTSDVRGGDFVLEVHLP